MDSETNRETDCEMDGQTDGAWDDEPGAPARTAGADPLWAAPDR